MDNNDGGGGAFATAYGIDDPVVSEDIIFVVVVIVVVTVGDNRSPLGALGQILCRCNLPSLDAKWRREARILEWETRRRVDDHWERQSQ